MTREDALRPPAAGDRVRTPEGEGEVVRVVAGAFPPRVVVKLAGGAEQTFALSAVRRPWSYERTLAVLRDVRIDVWFCDDHPRGTVTWDGDVARCDACGRSSE